MLHDVLWEENGKNLGLHPCSGTVWSRVSGMISFRAPQSPKPTSPKTIKHQPPKLGLPGQDTTLRYSSSPLRLPDLTIMYYKLFPPFFQDWRLPSSPLFPAKKRRYPVPSYPLETPNTQLPAFPSLTQSQSFTHHANTDGTPKKHQKKKVRLSRKAQPQQKAKGNHLRHQSRHHPRTRCPLDGVHGAAEVRLPVVNRVPKPSASANTTSNTQRKGPSNGRLHPSGRNPLPEIKSAIPNRITGRTHQLGLVPNRKGDRRHCPSQRRRRTKREGHPNPEFAQDYTLPNRQAQRERHLALETTPGHDSIRRGSQNPTGLPSSREEGYPPFPLPRTDHHFRELLDKGCSPKVPVLQKHGIHPKLLPSQPRWGLSLQGAGTLRRNIKLRNVGAGPLRSGKEVELHLPHPQPNYQWAHGQSNYLYKLQPPLQLLLH